MRSLKLIATAALLAGSWSPAAQAASSVSAIQSRDAGRGVQSRGTFQPVEVTDLKAVYDLGDIKLARKEAVYLDVPAHLRGGDLDFVSITHRQSPHEEQECYSTPEQDCLPGYTSLEIWDSVQTKDSLAWRAWAGTGSGPHNSKFAEIRSGRGETDNLYEWQKKGHVSVESDDHSRDPIHPYLLRVRSVGPDDIRVQKVVVKIAPPRPNAFDSRVFAPGLDFGDFATAKGRRFPGNPSMGDYGDALALDRHFEPAHSALPPKWRVEKGTIYVPLEAGTKLRALDIACGDMKPVPYGGDPQDYRGGAYLTVKRVRGGQVLETLMDWENVGTNGVMRALPARLDQVTGKGEELQVSAPAGRAQIMGLRVGFDR